MTQDIDALFDEIKLELKVDFVPQMFTLLTHQPDMLAATWALTKATLLRGNINRVYKEVLFAFTARMRQCEYCETAHKALALQLGFDSKLLDCVHPKGLKYIEPEILRNMLQLAEQLLTNNRSNAPKVLKKLTLLGFDKNQVDETIAAVGAASHLSLLANGLALNELSDTPFQSILQARIERNEPSVCKQN